MPYIGKKPENIIATAVDTTTGTFSGDVTSAGTVNVTGDTAAGDDAAIGFTSAEGLILTGQGSTSDVIIKNDADTTVCFVPTGTDDLKFNDSAAILLGTDSDMQIIHDGSNSIISDNGTGNLVLRSNATAVEIDFNTDETSALFNHNGSVELYHDNSKKFETASGGVTIFDQELKVTSATGDNADKTGAFTTGHYDTDEENVAGVIVNSANGDNIVNIGGAFNAYNSATKIRFYTGANATTVSGTERGRFDPSGNFLVGTTSSDSAGQGARLKAGGRGDFTVSGGICSILNRNSSDGAILAFNQDNNNEGTVSVSGSTISYNAFSGSHWSRLTDNSKPTILKGTIIETIDEMCDWYQARFTVPATEDAKEYVKNDPIALPDGKSAGDTITYTYDGTDYSAKIIKEDDNKHTKCKISDTADSKRVYGVFCAWDADDDTVNDMYVTAVGTHVVRINKDVTVSAGDLLSSNGDGTAKVQDDDIIRSKTIGKVLTNIKQETYSDGSYTVPCALYCG